MHKKIKFTYSDKRMYLNNKRGELGMTQMEFAEMLGIKYGTYVKYEKLNSGTRNISDKLFEDMTSKIEQYEKEHKGEIVGKIIVSRYLEYNRDEIMLSLFTRYEREIASVMFNKVLDIIKTIENRADVPYLKVRR